MIFTSTSDVQDALLILIKSKCCLMCILRFLGEQDISTYQLSYQDILVYLKNRTIETSSCATSQCPELHESLAETTQDLVPCSACLGILQEKLSGDVVREVVSKVKSSGYDFTTFVCSLSLPVSSIIRQHSLLLRLKDNMQCNTLIQDNDIVDIKDAWKWIYGPQISELLSAMFDKQSKFNITLTFDYTQDMEECRSLTLLKPEEFCRRKSKKSIQNAHGIFTRISVTKALHNVCDEDFRSCIHIPPKQPPSFAVCSDISCSHEAIFIAGRYNKYSRTLSQTPWIIEGVRKSPTSVEELISEPLLKHYSSLNSKFSSSGREDVDVLMLGRGRPFVLELIEPHKAHLTKDDICKIEKQINDSTSDVFVRDLQIVSREDISTLKIGEQTKTKCYQALCWSEKSLNTLDLGIISSHQELKIYQKTPIRVLHRRNLAVREKTIHHMVIDVLDEHHFKLGLSTQAGTYIKEFIHGDLGRTTPSLSNILKSECDIVELDVEEVNIDWPPAISHR